jgi:hypothetical protein
MKTFSGMTLRELADWVIVNNNGMFDPGGFPDVDDYEDDEEEAIWEEYEAMAYEILNNAAVESEGGEI